MGDKELCGGCGGAIIGLGLSSFILYLIFGPLTRKLVPSVENGVLYTLDFDNGTSTLTYNLSAVFSIHNPHIYRLRADISAESSYGGVTPATYNDNATFLSVPSKKTRTVSVVFTGLMTAVHDDLADAYAEDTARGYHIIEAKLHLTLPGTSFYKSRRCDSTCILYFPAPTLMFPLPGAVTTLLVGQECKIKCKSSGINVHLVYYLPEILVATCITLLICIGCGCFCCSS